MSTNWKISSVSKNETYTHIEAYNDSKGGTILKRIRPFQYLNIRVLYIILQDAEWNSKKLLVSPR